MSRNRGPAPAIRLDQILSGVDQNDLPFWLLLSVNGQHPHPVVATHVADFIRLPLLETIDTWVRGTVLTCPHQPRPERFQVGVAHAGHSGITCPRCEPPCCDDARPGTTCTLCAGPATRTVTVVFGPIRYRAPTCADCTPTTTPLPPTGTSSTQ
jgi:hypothetical protein